MKRNDTLIDLALEIALDVHRGQRDRYGAPYMLHVLRVAHGARNEDDTVAALLHDVVEKSDGAVTFITLRQRGIPRHIVDIVDCLSKRRNGAVDEQWDAYIARVMSNPAAMRIKLLDLEDNLDARRTGAITADDAARFTRYLQAWRRIRAAEGPEQWGDG